jgi:hypothetical protein
LIVCPTWVLPRGISPLRMQLADRILATELIRNRPLHI